MERRFRYALWGAVAVAAVTLWTGLASVSLLDPDESRYARTSLEMLRSGDIVVPSFEGHPRLTKPPLVHWVQGALFHAFGASEWSARLHSVLAALGAILLTGRVARRRFGAEGGFWAAVCLATLPLVIILGRVGTLDAFLMLHVFAALSLDIADPDGGGRWRGAVVGGLLGLGFLIKGPIAVLLPLIAMLAGRTLAGRDLLPALRSILHGSIGWAVVVLPWGVAFAVRIGGATAGATWRREILDRIFAGTDHVEPPWYYLTVLGAACLPWWATFAAALWRMVREWKASPSKTARYAVGGFIAGVALLSLSKGKLPSYILPLLPLMALACSWEIGRQLAAPRRRGPAIAFTAALFGYATLFGVVGWARLEGPYRQAAMGGAALFLAAALMAAFGTYRHRPRLVYGGAVAATAIFLIVVVRLLHPALARTNSAQALIEAVPELRSPRPVVRVEMQLPSLTFYLDRIPEEVDLGDLEARMQRDDGAMYILADVDLPALPAGLRKRLHALGTNAKLHVFEVNGKE